MKAAAIATAAIALALAPIAPAQMGMGMVGANVSILFGSLTPTHVDVIAGESVDWSNDSVRNHTVTDDSGAFDSGSFGPNMKFEHTFLNTGTFTYHCRLHPYIRGEVDVHTVLLDRPAAPAGSGKQYPLTGRAALPSGTDVAIEFDGGSGYQHVADASVGPDGHFTAPVTATASGSYRAVAGDEASPPVDLLVIDRTVTARASGKRVTVSVGPAAPGATVVLQLYLKEHFGWWPVATRKLDKSSRAAFTLGHHHRVSARVLLTLPDGATQLAASTVLHLRAG